MKLFGNRRRAVKPETRRPAPEAADQPAFASPAEDDEIPEPRNRRFRLTGLQRGLTLLVLSVALLVLECFGIYKFYVKPPAAVKPNTTVSNTQNGTTTPTSNKVTTLDPDTGEELEVELETPGDHKDGYYNILLVGTDDDGTRTDTIIIARLDTNDHTVALLSVPRDTYINANYAVPKINGAFGVGGKGEKGMESLKKYLKGILGFDVDGYVMVDLEAFVKTVDLIGGVEFNVPRNMYYSDPTQNLYINLSAGLQTLDGEHAMQLVRYRSYAQADIERIKVQQQFLAAMAKQCLTLSNLTKLNGFAKIFNEYVLTDLSVGNMIYFAQELVKCDFNSMETYTLPGEGLYISGGAYYILYPNQVLEMINAHFNPYETDIPAGNLQIRTVSSGSHTSSSSSSSASSGNSSGQSGSSGASQPEDPPKEPPAEPGDTEGPTNSDPSQTPGGSSGDVQNPLIEEPLDPTSPDPEPQQPDPVETAPDANPTPTPQQDEQPPAVAA